MPIGLSAKKSLRKSIKNHKANVALKSKVKTIIKSYLTKPSAEGLVNVYSMLDKAVKNHVFHANKAARLKSSYSKKVSTEKKTVKNVKKMS